MNMPQIASLSELTNQTSDYKKFKMLDGNRRLYHRHIQELVTSLEKHPDLSAIRPILINENWEIIDGQHFFEANKFLKRPITYIQYPGLTVETAQFLNSTQRPWHAIDFAESYANSGNREYQDFLKYLRDYELGINPTITILQGYHSHTSNKNFRTGGFKIRADREVADAMFEHIQEVGQTGQGFKQWRTYNFAISMFTIQRLAGYDPKRMLEKLKGERITQEGSRTGYLKQLEDLYNKKVQPENWLRFLG